MEPQEYTVANHANDLLGDIEIPAVQAPVVETPPAEVTPPATPQATPPTETPPVDTPPVTSPPTDTPPSVEYNPVIEQMRSSFAQKGITVEIPEQFKSPDVEIGEVYKFINDTLQKESINSDPFISQYMKAKESGISHNDFIKQKVQQQELLNLPDRDFMSRLYQARNGKTEKNPNGWDENAISQHINKMSPIELSEATNQYKAELTKKFDSFEQAKKTPEQITEAQTLQRAEVEKVANKIITTMSKRSEIGGMPHTQADIDDFKPVFLDMVEKNPSTGRPRVQELLSDDDVLYDMLYIYHKTKNGGLKKYLSQFKEAYKAEVLEKTGIKPKGTPGSTYTYSVPKPEDFA